MSCDIIIRGTESDKMRGRIKMFDQSKGFGFITTMDNTDVFFHFSHLIIEGFKSIEPGTEVEFELVETKRGIQAHNILRIS